MTSAYAKERVQYGKPIGGFQIIQHYMANMLIAYDTIWNYLYRVAYLVDEGEDYSLEASVLKSRANENYLFITDRAVQIHGGIGTTREYDVALFMRRAKSYEFVAGDTDWHSEKVTAGILEGMPSW
jgi:alkylation response protein AidB-like acyl-CoA dehydrogenase